VGEVSSHDPLSQDVGEYMANFETKSALGPPNLLLLEASIVSLFLIFVFFLPNEFFCSWGLSTEAKLDEAFAFQEERGSIRC
jgi:hypothetical protein